MATNLSQSVANLPDLGPSQVYNQNVVTLQQALMNAGYLSPADYNTGPGYYGTKTQAAVAAWQQAMGINTNGNPGYFGPLSRAAVVTPPASTNTNTNTSQPAANIPSGGFSQYSSWQLSPWSSTGLGTYSQQPVLVVDGKTYTFSNPNDYIKTLQNMQSAGVGGNLSLMISQFQSTQQEWSNAASAAAAANTAAANKAAADAAAKAASDAAARAAADAAARAASDAAAKAAADAAAKAAANQPTSYPTVAMTMGSTDVANVKKLQDALVKDGYMTQAQVNTGYGTYGPQTEAAVKALQAAKGINNSTGPGSFGPVTMAWISSNPNNTRNPSSPVATVPDTTVVNPPVVNPPVVNPPVVNPPVVNPPVVTPTTPTVYPTVSLTSGSTDIANVKKLQDALVKDGYMTQAQVDTGYGTYGPQTLAAVKAMQVAKGIDNSTGPGSFGPVTMAWISSNPNNTRNPSSPVSDVPNTTNPTNPAYKNGEPAKYPTVNLQPGSTDIANIKMLQDALVRDNYMNQEDVDTGYGFYGTRTTKAVLQLQKDLGVDNSSGPGFFGPATRAAIQVDANTSSTTTTGPKKTIANSPYPTVSLTMGSTDEANVKKLQDALVANGFMTQAEVDTGYGTYGTRTQIAVKKLQELLGVDNSSGPGSFGPKTIAAITAKDPGEVVKDPVTGAPVVKTAAVYPTVTLEPGSSDVANIKLLQDALVKDGYMTQDQVDTGYGTYGPRTIAAVLRMQQDMGVDYQTGPGVFGVRTIAALKAKDPNAVKTDNATPEKPVEKTERDLAKEAFDKIYGNGAYDSNYAPDGSIIPGSNLALGLTPKPITVRDKIKAQFDKIYGNGAYDANYDLKGIVIPGSNVALGKSPLIPNISGTQPKGYPVYANGSLNPSYPGEKPVAYRDPVTGVDRLVGTFPGGLLPDGTENSAVTQLPPETLKILTPQLIPGTPEYQAAMDKISSSYFDIMQQQMTATNDQQKQAADYNWTTLKDYIQKNLNVTLSNDAYQAWDQMQQIKNQAGQGNIMNSGIQNETVDAYLRKMRNTDAAQRSEAMTKQDQAKMEYYQKFASSDQIKQLNDTNPAQAQAWGLVPSADMQNAMSVATLKQKYPNLSDSEIASYRASILDEKTGLYRSSLYQKYMTGANNFVDPANVKSTTDASGYLSSTVTPSDTGMLDIQSANLKNKNQQVLDQNANTANTAAREVSLPNTNASDPNSYTAGGNAVAKPITVPLSMTTTPSQTATTSDPLGLNAAAAAANKMTVDNTAADAAAKKVLDDQAAANKAAADKAAAAFAASNTIN